MQQSSTFTFLSPESVVRSARIEEGMHVADFHAAAGFFVRAAARAVGPGGRVWAVDARRDMLLRLRSTALMEGLQNIEIVRGNMEHRGGTLLPEEGLDMVLLATALHTANDMDGVIEEAWRVLKSGSGAAFGPGRLLVIDWKDTFGGLGPSAEHIVTREDALSRCVRGGFVLIEDIPAGDYHWGMLLKKKV